MEWTVEQNMEQKACMTEVMAAERFNCFQTYTTAKANIFFEIVSHVFDGSIPKSFKYR